AAVLVFCCTSLLVAAAQPQAARAQAQVQAPAGVQAGRIRFVPDNPTASFRVRARYPAKPGECPVNQPKDLVAAYPGMLEVGRGSDGRLFVVTELTFPQYLKGIAEVPAQWPLEALKAQVVAARTYAMAHLNPSTAEARDLGYDLCSTDACQVYRGLQVERGPWGDQWAKAVDQTQDEILEYQDKPATTFYSSTSNGHTYSNADIFGGAPLPYLKPIIENDDKESPTSSWTVRMPLGDLAETLRRSGAWGAGPLEAVSLEGDKVTLSGAGASGALTLDSFRNRLNHDAVCLEPKRYPTPATVGKGNLPQVVPSKWMTLRQEGSSIVMDGRGWGHGVGMVQWGAKGKAERGMRYADILAAYYGGLRPTKTAEPDRIRILIAKGVEELTIEPDGPVHAEGTTLRGGPVVIRGGQSMTVDRGAPVATALSLTNVATVGTGAAGAPSSFTFELSAPANISIRYQGAGGAQEETPPEPRDRGPQTVMWDPASAGLGPGSHDAVLVADDGVTQVLSAAQKVTIPAPSPSPKPEPSASVLATQAKREPGAGWQVPVFAAFGIVLATVAGLVIVRTRKPGRHSR
ncbi:MAG TPA: SpoIID/LytB domain-containing protein, partial [Actinomycetota bacterium]